ncbi:hypothetical protein ACFT5D_07835 [Streptomyces sp. NPDC057144]|uniref:hypothetical protein n=1 Tax=Streptomyces sp. NPDC057144 TaxID=3346034 RepID=UPI00363DBB13
MNDSFKMTRASLEALRAGDGLTASALAQHPGVLEHLDTDDPYEGVERLSQLALKLDTRAGDVLRGVMAIGTDRLKNAAARRAAAEARFSLSTSQRWRDERDALEQLTRLVLAYKQSPAAAEDDPFQQAEPVTVEPDDQEATTTPTPVPIRKRPPKITAMTWVDGLHGWGLAAFVAACFIISGMLVFGIFFLVSVLTRDSQASDGVESQPTATAGPKPVLPPLATMENTYAHWGPDRITYTWQRPPRGEPALNSFTDNPVYGDERNFVRCRTIGEDGYANGEWSEYVEAKDAPMDTAYQCHIWFNNDVKIDADDSKTGPYTSWARETRARIEVTSVLGITDVLGYVSAANAEEVKDTARIRVPEGATVVLVPSSVQICMPSIVMGGIIDEETTYFDGKEGAALASKDGLLLGAQQDGYLGGSGGYVLFDVKVAPYKP